MKIVIVSTAIDKSGLLAVMRKGQGNVEVCVDEDGLQNRKDNLLIIDGTCSLAPDTLHRLSSNNRMIRIGQWDGELQKLPDLNTVETASCFLTRGTVWEHQLLGFVMNSVLSSTESFKGFLSWGYVFRELFNFDEKDRKKLEAWGEEFTFSESFVDEIFGVMRKIVTDDGKISLLKISTVTDGLKGGVVFHIETDETWDHLWRFLKMILGQQFEQIMIRFEDRRHLELSVWEALSTWKCDDEGLAICGLSHLEGLLKA